jgi:ABC-type phosphate transport system substrate-binding protein
MGIFRFLTTAALLAALATAAQAADIVVIVSAHSPVNALRADQVAEIFLAQHGQFPGGEEAAALDLPVGNPLRDEFYARVAGKTPAMMKAHWTKMVFTGRGQPPREVASSQSVRKLVADNPGLIGYIERSALDASVKPVLVPR